MKKIINFIVILAIIIVTPFCFVGCDSNKTASQIADEYSTIQTEYAGLFNTSTREFTVTFSGSTINSSMNNSSSKIYSLGRVYLPMINASMGVVNNYAKTFKACLERFSQDDLNKVYAGMKKFESSLQSFKTEKQSFDSRNKADGSGYATFINSMLTLIDGALEFNLAFYNAYYTNIFVKDRDYNAAGYSATQEDAKVELLGGKLYLANILNARYVKYYVWSSSYSIGTYLNRAENTYFNKTIDGLTLSDVTNYVQTHKDTLVAMRDGHDTFLVDMNKAVETMNSFDYKGYYKATMPSQFMEELTASQRANYDAVERFLDTKLLPYYYGIYSLTI